MFCIKNSDGLFFNGTFYGEGGNLYPKWATHKMVTFDTKEEIERTVIPFLTRQFEILPLKKKEEIKDKRYLYTSAFDVVMGKFVGIDHAFERNGVFYFVCYYTQHGEMFVLEEERLIRFCLQDLNLNLWRDYLNWQSCLCVLVTYIFFLFPV